MTEKQRARYEEAKRIHAEIMKIYPFHLENLEGELWKNIDDYEKRYQISTFGRVKSFLRGKTKNP